MTWRATVDEQGSTTIIANFGDKDPNVEWTDVNVRPTVFYPRKPGLKYISLRGFTIMNAACHWAPPIEEQVAAVGPNGGHHWIIENNTILYGWDIAGCAFRDRRTTRLQAITLYVIMSSCAAGQAGIAGQSWNSHSVIARTEAPKQAV